MLFMSGSKSFNVYIASKIHVAWPVREVAQKPLLYRAKGDMHRG